MKVTNPILIEIKKICEDCIDYNTEFCGFWTHISHQKSLANGMVDELTEAALNWVKQGRNKMGYGCPHNKKILKVLFG